jgi:hypothetical protein
VVHVTEPPQGIGSAQPVPERGIGMFMLIAHGVQVKVSVVVDLVVVVLVVEVSEIVVCVSLLEQ